MPPQINAPPKGAFIRNILLFPGKKHVYTLFELLNEDIVEAAPSFNLIDEENDDESRNIVNFLKFCRLLFYVRRKSPKFYKRPPLLNVPLK